MQFTSLSKKLAIALFLGTSVPFLLGAAILFYAQRYEVAVFGLWLLSIIISIAIFYYFRRRAIKPIKALSDLSMQIAKGENKPIPQPASRDEVGQLYYSVKAMKDSLLEQVRKLERISQFKSEFISLASHQLRTPLSAIKWLIELIMDSGSFSASQKEKLQDVYKSNERLIALVNDLLNAAKLEGGEIVARRVPSNLVKLVQSEMDMQNLDAKMKKITVNLKIETEIKEVNLDPLLFTQAFKNLLENAIAYSPESSTVDVVIKSERDSYVVSVHNEGAVISELEHDKLFTKFYRGPVAQRLRPSGSGLGLFIAKLAVESVGGSIWFESPTHDGGGVTFFMSIPLNAK